jgi:hypothetical protein
MKKTTLTLLTLVTLTVDQSFGAVFPREVNGPNLPPIWEAASAKDRLNSIKAAELDADRLLIERVQGAEIETGTRVRDLISSQDLSQGLTTGFITGAQTVKAPIFLPDGQVQVIRQIQLEQVIEYIKRVVKQKSYKNGPPQVTSDVTTPSIKTVVTTLDVVGNSALPGSEGHRKIMSKRAAEIDCYRRLASRLKGMTIASETLTENFAFDSDQVDSNLIALVKDAVVKDIQYNKQDGSCKVTMELVITEPSTSSKTNVAFNKKSTTTTTKPKTFKIVESGFGTFKAPTTAFTSSDEEHSFYN